jgi:hypothetical protein
MLTVIFISSSLILRIRFGFSGLVNIQRQLGDILRNPPGLGLYQRCARAKRHLDR